VRDKLAFAHTDLYRRTETRELLPRWYQVKKRLCVRLKRFDEHISTHVRLTTTRQKTSDFLEASRPTKVRTSVEAGRSQHLLPQSVLARSDSQKDTLESLLCLKSVPVIGRIEKTEDLNGAMCWWREGSRCTRLARSVQHLGTLRSTFLGEWLAGSLVFSEGRESGVEMIRVSGLGAQDLQP
jgi:hypothetical protein